MGKLITIVGASGVGKTTLVKALGTAAEFATGLEQHKERPFQALFKINARYALANQIDYLLLRAEQERALRAQGLPALVDGGLDVDFHIFTRLFHRRNLLSDPEFALCERFYNFIRAELPSPDLIIHLTADVNVISHRIRHRDRINIAAPEDAALMESLLSRWLATVEPGRLLSFDVSNVDPSYAAIIPGILQTIATL